MNDYDMSIHTNPDAKAWAEFYKKTFPDADEDLMLGWFANAIMAMHDHLNNTKIEPQKEEIQALQARVAELKEVLGILNGSMVAPHLIDDGFKDRVKAALNKTDTQSLADIQADAILKATASVFPKCGVWNASIAPYMLSNRNSFIEYANQLRKESE